MMGKWVRYRELSGQYYYRTKKQALENLKSARKHDKNKEFIMRITGSRKLFWTLTITKKRKRKREQ
jgi:hypothetical protein